MPSVFAYLAPVALLLPFGAVDDGVRQMSQEESRFQPSELGLTAEPERISRSIPFGEWAVPQDIVHQVRIERRVTVRIVPRGRVPRQSLMADLSQAPEPTRFEERKMEKCLPINNIAGVQTGSGDRLVLFLRDRRMVSARLEKACRARDFYSGFYVEQNEDGMLCVDRDQLQSRAGANCEISRLRELVPASD